MRVARPVVLHKQKKAMLGQIARGRSLPARLVERARIVPRAASGMQNQQIASELAITPEKAARWRNRYLDGGIDALEKDASRPGRPRTITGARTAEVIRKTTQRRPLNATHWSTRTMAAATVRRIWRANGLKPHLVKPFKVRNDARFAEKPEAIVGLYPNPPALNLGRKCTPPKVSAIPHFPMVREENARQGFLTDQQYAKLRDALPDYLKPLFVVAYFTGVRLGELLAWTWHNVDFAQGFVTLDTEDTKSGYTRAVPIITGDMRTWLEWLLDNANGCDRVFHRAGTPIKYFRSAWIAARALRRSCGCESQDIEPTRWSDVTTS